MLGAEGKDLMFRATYSFVLMFRMSTDRDSHVYISMKVIFKNKISSILMLSHYSQSFYTTISPEPELINFFSGSKKHNSFFAS